MNDAEQTKRIVKWYQTILSTACGYVDVPVNGNHNDVLTKPAFRNFQETYGLEALWLSDRRIKLCAESGGDAVDLSSEPFKHNREIY